MIKILWIDDEIDFFKSHIIILEKNGYSVQSCKSGSEALEILKKKEFNVILIDQNMPGISGTESISLMNKNLSNIPIIMISQNIDDITIDKALGLKIKDYLIKPLNPNQLLLSLKKIFNNKNLVNDSTISSYQSQFNELNNKINSCDNINDWITLYKDIIYWELQISKTDDKDVLEIIRSQKKHANNLFCAYIEKNYQNLIVQNDFINSINLFRKKISNEITNKRSTLMILIDNLRYDQWKTIEPLVTEDYTLKSSSLYCSILPTTTQYSRNSIFSGLSPIEIAKKHPKLWKDEFDYENKNKFEKELLDDQLKKLNLNINYKFFKVADNKNAIRFKNNLNNLKSNDFSVLVYNMVDMISHAKKDVKFIKEMIPTEKAYRELTLSWFKNSEIYQIIKKAKEIGLKIIITTDHGTIKVDKPSLVSGDKEISNNFRYKTSKQIHSIEKDSLSINEPSKFLLPSNSLSSCYIFAKNSTFFVYKNNYNDYVKMFTNTYQHGGISMDEILIPFVVLIPNQ
tara:strand:+ start:803 stop:2344 length:1542 start_codon:yes stop_codon:yes gene_type:complete